ncbi:hypothetical protein [Haladaptatus sp. DYF46]|uniref:hypothetical protein n=1 Tax=Haladaptatus sp. DYF46 TaxID=2886041 RepID=UPI001E5CC642|nr:hypothetical protein [Haladaptatus sp. DYF46]
MTEIGKWSERHSVEDTEKEKPYVIVIAYGNNGEKFTQQYAATEPGDWDLLAVVQEDTTIQDFSDELRNRFDDAVHKTHKVEQRYH